MHRPQEDHADLGLVDNDNTEDMRTAPVYPDAPTSGGSRPFTSTVQEKETNRW